MKSIFWFRWAHSPLQHVDIFVCEEAFTNLFNISIKKKIFILLGLYRLLILRFKILTFFFFIIEAEFTDSQQVISCHLRDLCEALEVYYYRTIYTYIYIIFIYIFILYICIYCIDRVVSTIMNIKIVYILNLKGNILYVDYKY